ncbi:THO complex subunit 1 [Thelohanellus kitauei]|uniref:THO complex subunit 1 n=1 Tax=Thelohanellus kitauei TaxID=669202 RepID=A0A0C2MDM0_THEKT|nr:THO complex subunit 1 [Thelohanellus kitauei]
MMDIKMRVALHCSLKSSDFKINDQAFSLVLFSLELSESNHYCSMNLVFLMLADMVELGKIECVSKAIEFIDEILPRLIVDPLYTSGKYTFLRMCNDLLKRLSNIKDHNVCGEIQMMLSKMFPLNEKSALNLTSELNTDKLSFVMLEENVFGFLIDRN